MVTDAASFIAGWSKMTDQFDGWRRLLKGEDVERNVDTPLAGFYRIRSKDKKTGTVRQRAVAYWYEDDKLFCLIDGREIDDLRAREQWAWASKNPIAHNVYRDVVENGKPWPDIDPIVHEQAENARAVAGNNNPPTDPAELLLEQITAAKSGAVAYAIITDEATAAKAQTLRDRLSKLGNEADTHREEAKKPHLKAAKNVDERWMPLVRLAKGAADGIKNAIEAFRTESLKKQRAEEAKAAEAERSRQAAIAKAERDAAAVGKQAPPPPPPVAPPPATTALSQVKGATGRTASAKPKLVAKSITDIDALYQYFRLRKEFADFMLGMAQRELDVGQKSVPGVEIEEKVIVT